MRHRATGELFSSHGALLPHEPLPPAFNNVDGLGAAGTRVSAATVPAIVPPEYKRLSIPSTWHSMDNIYCPIEMKLRMAQADKTLQNLRNTIADKSFQYSHVIRVAPRKGVRTRARTAIAKLNCLITYYSHVYSQCRAAIVRLGADNTTLDKYKILHKDDVKSSTALLNPNEPGSTRIQLSWIWQTSPCGHGSQQTTFMECK